MKRWGPGPKCSPRSGALLATRLCAERLATRASTVAVAARALFIEFGVFILTILLVLMAAGLLSSAVGSICPAPLTASVDMDIIFAAGVPASYGGELFEVIRFMEHLDTEEMAWTEACWAGA